MQNWNVLVLYICDCNVHWNSMQSPCFLVSRLLSHSINQIHFVCYTRFAIFTMTKQIWLMCQHKILRVSRKGCYEEIHKASSRFGEHPLDRTILWGARECWPWIDLQLDSSLVEGQFKIIIQRDDSPGKHQRVWKDSWISS